MYIYYKTVSKTHKVSTNNINYLEVYLSCTLCGLILLLHVLYLDAWARSKMRYSGKRIHLLSWGTLPWAIGKVLWRLKCRLRLSRKLLWGSPLCFAGC